MDIVRSLVYDQHDIASVAGDTTGVKSIRKGTPLSATELRQAFGPNVVGTNAYFGINSYNLDLGGFDNNTAPTIQGWIDLVNPGEEFTIMLGIEPNDADPGMVGANCFNYVLDNLQIIDALAARLRKILDSVNDAGKVMRCVVRYASEMNKAPGNHWSGLPDLYQQTYPKVCGALKAVCPELLFAFSPGINYGDVSDIPNYFPESGPVDLAGCTWYSVGSDANFAAAEANLKTYFDQFATDARQPCIDELGGSFAKDPTGNNEPQIEAMRNYVLGIDSTLSIQHVTYFCASVWGAGATLSFLNPTPDA